MRLSKKVLDKEHEMMEIFLQDRLAKASGHIVAIRQVYYEYKRFYLGTKLSVDGFGRMLPKWIREHGKLKWFNGKPRRCLIGFDIYEAR